MDSNQTPFTRGTAGYSNRDWIITVVRNSGPVPTEGFRRQGKDDSQTQTAGDCPISTWDCRKTRFSATSLATLVHREDARFQKGNDRRHLYR
ncbi:hypothetical protein J6590_043239 [Homalodisca vitripennis]|nr:hypothetical protein J6590_043239 [Homalodisca vitripennis]